MSAKIVKNTSYFSRFQTPFRRRREYKTEYVQRSSLIQQDRTKYGQRKYRLVARITNTKVIAQVIAAELDHDVTIAQATSKELERYGITLGLTNYAAAYAVGLLVARRLLKQLNLEQKFLAPIPGTPAADDDDEDEDARKPFKVILDVGLRRTTTGARVFAVMKGAADGGLFVPHKEDRLAGSTAGKRSSRRRGGDDDDAPAKGAPKAAKPAGKPAGKGGAPAKAPPPKAAPAKAAPAKGGAAPAAKAAKPAPKGPEGGSPLYFILGGHVAAYMAKLRDTKPDAYQRQFSQYIAKGIGPEQLAKLYEDAHQKIRANPAPAPKATEHYKLPKPQTPKLKPDERRRLLNQRLVAAGLAPRS
jgi:large subunit ribosomal protein L5e